MIINAALALCIKQLDTWKDYSVLVMNLCEGGQYTVNYNGNQCFKKCFIIRSINNSNYLTLVLHTVYCTSTQNLLVYLTLVRIKYCEKTTFLLLESSYYLTH